MGSTVRRRRVAPTGWLVLPISPAVRHPGPPARFLQTLSVGPVDISCLVRLMASSSHSPAPSDEPPPEPPTLRLKPQARGNIGAGKQYADRVAFDADVQAWEEERKDHKALMAERKKAKDRQRDRSERQRNEDDSTRRVAQRRATNPNVLPQAVVGALDKILQGEAHTWCSGGRITAAIIADGLPPPQCLLDFLDGGGSADAHPPSEDAFSKSTLLQLASDSTDIALPRVVELLLQRGADVRGALCRCSPLELATRWWYPITKPCPAYDCPNGCDEGGRCFCFANATAQEKVIRLLLAAGARDKYALERIASLTLENACEEVCRRNQYKLEPDRGVRHGWDAARLREMQNLFWYSHPHEYR